MAIVFDDKTAKFESVIYEDEVVALRDFLQANAGDEVKFDFNACEDVHLAVLQLVMAYKKSYNCTYEFSPEDKLYMRVLKGFDSSENNCN